MTDDSTAMDEELGDLLFSVVNLARFRKVDPEVLMAAANTKFETRFATMERDLKLQGRCLETATTAEMETAWQTRETATIRRRSIARIISPVRRSAMVAAVVVAATMVGTAVVVVVVVIVIRKRIAQHTRGSGTRHRDSGIDRLHGTPRRIVGGRATRTGTHDPYQHRQEGTTKQLGVEDAFFIVFNIVPNWKSSNRFLPPGETALIPKTRKPLETKATPGR